MDYHNEVRPHVGRDQDYHNATPRCVQKPQKLQKLEPVDDYLRQILIILDQMRQDDTLKKAHARRRGEWMLVAYVVDRFLFFFFILSACFVSSLILCQYMYYPQTHDDSDVSIDLWHLEPTYLECMNL